MPGYIVWFGMVGFVGLIVYGFTQILVKINEVRDDLGNEIIPADEKDEA